MTSVDLDISRRIHRNRQGTDSGDFILHADQTLEVSGTGRGTILTWEYHYPAW